MSDPIVSLIPPTLVPSGVRDDRQAVLAQTFGEALAAIDISTLSMVDPLTVDARLLPFMIREFGAQEFIDPDFPEYVQRRMLKHIWELKSLHGYDAGVRLGLSLIGMRMVLKHWHQSAPMGPANTNTITFLVGEALFDEDAVLGPRIIAAAHRMIAVTKRKSQESAIRIGVDMRRDIRLGSAATPLEIARPCGTAKRPSSFKSPVGIAPVSAMVGIVRPKAEAKRLTHFSAKVGATAGVTFTQINRISAQAA